MNKIILSLVLLVAAAFASVNTKTCTGCHGQNFEKKAMGKSKIVKDMSKQEVSNALIGFKNGTYGGSMKAVMKNQVAKYSEEELRSTGIGKSTFSDKVKGAAKKTLSKTKDIASKTKTKVTSYFAKKDTKTKVLFSEYKKYAYKSGDNCWVVDYKYKKSKSVDCEVLIKRSKIDRHPMQPDMPSFIFRDLFK